MSWLENVRNKTKKEKTRLITIICGFILLFLVIFWALIGSYNPFDESSKSFWQEIKSSINNANQ